MEQRGHELMKQALIENARKPGGDEYHTPAYAVRPLIRHIPANWTVWEPTDTNGKSEIARLLRENGNKVVSTKETKFDFLVDDPTFHFDCVVTNPPYSTKDFFIHRCVALGKPFALLLPVTALEGVRRGKMFRELGKRFGLLVLDRRVEFGAGSVWFNTSWFCGGILSGQVIFAEIEKE
jgi:hypothetical protein